jgi:prepilin-type N-terminal cleavage/methylation domain-containing protein
MPMRSSKAMTIIELLVAIVVMGIALAGMTELLWLNTTWNMRISNKIDNASAVNFFLQRIGKDIKNARNIGDLVDNTTTYDGYDLNLPNTNQTLILQTASYPTTAQDPNQFPLSIRAGSPLVNQEQVDTKIYQLVADPLNAGQYIIQYLVFPGPGSQTTAITSPQTVLKGIIGPISLSTGQPAVFRYLSPFSQTPIDSITLNQMPNITGVSINLDTLNQNSSTQQKSYLATSSQFFMRSAVTLQ